MFTFVDPTNQGFKISVGCPTSFQEHHTSDWSSRWTRPRVVEMASLHHEGKQLLPKTASARGMQAPSSKVPTVKFRDSVQKQRSDLWAGPSPISTFVRCLRLLDLDLLEDWPAISEDTFSTISAKQNLQSRIKCVEWSLYRLFELWNPSETRDVW